MSLRKTLGIYIVDKFDCCQDTQRYLQTCFDASCLCHTTQLATALKQF